MRYIIDWKYFDIDSMMKVLYQQIDVTLYLAHTFSNSVLAEAIENYLSIGCLKR